MLQCLFSWEAVGRAISPAVVGITNITRLTRFILMNNSNGSSTLSWHLLSLSRRKCISSRRVKTRNVIYLSIRHKGDFI